jgi:hypothetical protein
MANGAAGCVALGPQTLEDQAVLVAVVLAGRFRIGIPGFALNGIRNMLDQGLDALLAQSSVFSNCIEEHLLVFAQRRRAVDDAHRAVCLVQAHGVLGLHHLEHDVNDLVDRHAQEEAGFDGIQFGDLAVLAVAGEHDLRCYPVLSHPVHVLEAILSHQHAAVLARYHENENDHQAQREEDEESPSNAG